MNQQESGAKLIKGQDSLQESYKVGSRKDRLTATTAFENGGMEEEEKSGEMAHQYKSVNLDSMRQSEPNFLKKGAPNQEVD